VLGPIISVSSVNGVVTLTGEVGGKREKARAGEIAGSVEQVVSVNNNLSVAPDYSDDAVGDEDVGAGGDRCCGEASRRQLRRKLMEDPLSYC
jgi:BON domain